MKTNLRLIVMFLSIFILLGCKTKFRKITDDFKNYNAELEMKNNSAIKKYYEGIYAFELCEEYREVEGTYIKWYGDCTEQRKTKKESEITSFKTFFAFLDNHRVIFYSPFDRKLFKDTFEITAPNDKHMSRGYYTINGNTIKMELEQRKFKRTVYLTFELEGDELRFTEYLKKERFSPVRNRDGYRSIKPQEVLKEQPPIYSFRREPIALYWELGDDACYIDSIESIQMDNEELWRIYYYRHGRNEATNSLSEIVKEEVHTW